MGYVLSSTEKNFADEHHNLVYAFLNRKKLNPEEYYDVVIFAYLNAVRRYFINKNLTQYNFSTIAWQAMEAAAYRESKKKKSIFRSLDEKIYEDSELTLIDTLGYEDNMDEKIVHMELVNKVMPCLTEKQEKTLLMKADGYSYKDMADVDEITKSAIGSRLSRARRKIRMILVEE